MSIIVRYFTVPYTLMLSYFTQLWKVTLTVVIQNTNPPQIFAGSLILSTINLQLKMSFQRWVVDSVLKTISTPNIFLIMFLPEMISSTLSGCFGCCEHCMTGYFNPFTLRAAKRGLTILEIFSLQKHFFENIWRRNVDQKINNNSPWNSSQTFALFPSYFQKYESSRRYF